MDKSGHLFLGTALGIILILMTHYFFGWFSFTLTNVALMIAIIYVYSLLPDLDAKSSQIVWTFIPLGLIAIIFGYYYTDKIYLFGGIGLITVTFFAAQFMPHRGFTHSILFGLAVSLPWIYVSWHLVILAFVCFYSHMIGDEEYLKFF